MVLVLKDGKNPVSRRVVLGLSDMRSYEVVSGLEEGETVVLGVSGASTTQPSAQGNMPFMGGNRVTVGPGAGGRR
jgi:HlyD family secretion protein